jgi:hypothetical protein
LKRDDPRAKQLAKLFRDFAQCETQWDLRVVTYTATSPHDHRARFLIQATCPAFSPFRPGSLVFNWPPFFINRMADQNLCETLRADQPNRLQVSEKRKPSNWLRSIVAGVGLLAFSVLVFDWWFFAVVDGLLSTLRPIAAEFRQASGDRQPRPLPSSSIQQRSRDRSVSLIVPVRSAANPQTPAN